MLELIRLKQIICVQSDHFAEIEIIKAEPPKETVPTEIPDQAIFEDEPKKSVATSPIKPLASELRQSCQLAMELKNILESVLFSAQEPLSVKDLREVLKNAAEHSPEAGDFKKVVL